MDKKPKTSRFKTSKPRDTEYVLSKRKKPNTNKATRLWLTCFTDYLAEKKLPTIDKLLDGQIPFILEQFYTEVRKKEKRDYAQDEEDDNDARLYKNTSLKAIWAALTRYFKETQSINIMSNKNYIRANEIFEGVQKINKEKGKGNIVSKPPIDDTDLVKITAYFKSAMNGPPNPVLLQEIVMFYTLLYMCHHGRENLRAVKKNTLSIAINPSDGREYIFQAVDEADKNHSHLDTRKSNDSRIYAVAGNFHSVSYF